MGDSLMERIDVNDVELLLSIQQRATALLQEVTVFKTYTAAHGYSCDIQHFLQSVELEARWISEMDRQKMSPSQLLRLKCSDLIFYEAVWSTARHCSGLTTLLKKVDGGTHTSIRVDVMADNGRQWIKVIPKSEKTLVWEMTKMGWSAYDQEELIEVGQGNSPDGSLEDHVLNMGSDEDDLPIAQAVRDFTQAARAKRVSFQHPEPRVVLPRIRLDSHGPIAAFLAVLRKTGALVECGTDIDSLLRHPIDESMMKSMLSSTISDLTPTLNVDCTTILALASDVSHYIRGHLPRLPSPCIGPFHKTDLEILTQIEDEAERPFLAELYPLIADRQLVCTSETASVALEIAMKIGSRNEQARTKLLLGQNSCKNSSLPPDSLREAWQILSTHPVPTTLHLSIQNLDFDAPSTLSAPPSAIFDTTIAREVFATLDFRNKSRRKGSATTNVTRDSWISGWRAGMATITRAHVAAKELTRLIDGILDERERSGQGSAGEPFVGPKLRVVDVGRSLLGTGSPVERARFQHEKDKD